MRRDAIFLLVASLYHIRLAESVSCDNDERFPECGVQMQAKGCRADWIHNEIKRTQSFFPGTECRNFLDPVCYCHDKCDRKWSLRRQFEVFFEKYFMSYGIVHDFAKCTQYSDVYEIGAHYPVFTVKLCSVRISMDRNGICSSTKQCFLTTRLALSEECTDVGGVVSCYCLDLKEKNKDCTADKHAFLKKFQNYIPYVKNSTLNSCVAELTQKKWPLTQTIPDKDKSYECIGKHVGGRKGLKVCALLLKNVDGSCELEQQSRSISGQGNECQPDGTGVLCYCLGNNCNVNEDNFHFKAYFHKFNHAAKSCLKMITYKVMSTHKRRKIGPHSYECPGGNIEFWKEGDTVCSVMMSMEGGVCVAKQVSRSVEVADNKVPQCVTEDKNLFCFCLGDNCNQNQKTVVDPKFIIQVEEFYWKEYVITGKVPDVATCRAHTDVQSGNLKKICGFGFILDSETVCEIFHDACFESYAPGVPDCFHSDTVVRCFCGGEVCQENVETIRNTFDVFFQHYPSHKAKMCYLKMIETTTVTTPTTTEQLTSTAETTMEATTESTLDPTTEDDFMTSSIETSNSQEDQIDELDTTTTDGVATTEKPASDISESDSSTTTRKDISPEIHEDEALTTKKADSWQTTISVLIAVVVFAIVVAIIIGCCVWYRRNKEKKPERVIEVTATPLVGPLPTPPTPTTPVTSATSITTTTSATNEKPATSGNPATSGPITSGNSATSGTAATSGNVAISGKAATSRKRAAPAAPAGPLRKRQKLTPGEVIARRIAKQRRRAELKKKAEIPVDMLSDRRFQRKGPLHFINVKKELPDDSLPSSVDLSGTGKMEFDDRGNEIFLLGTDIEIIDDSVRTQRTQDEDDVEATQADDEDEPKKEGGTRENKKKKKKRSTGTGTKRHHKKHKRSKNRDASKNP